MLSMESAFATASDGHSPVASYGGDARQRQIFARLQFRDWLRRHRSTARKHPFSHLLASFDGSISKSSAYRAALMEGLRGQRLNKTRYAEFWATINWDLPDSVLSRVWAVKRGNLRQRRNRLQVGPPQFRALDISRDTVLRGLINQECKHARNFSGPRPR
jgi:hypothetical protein